jgi:NAD(P)-dependent dehydrogenase (short-subunit alcohol dehydrogenase family)
MIKRWILITGGARRLGREFCIAFLRNGWGVVCHYHTSKEDTDDIFCEMSPNPKGDGSFITLCADLGTTDGQISLFNRVMRATNGRLDAVINNASVFEEDTGISFSPDSLQRQLAINLIAPLNIGKLLAKSMPDNEAPLPVVIHVLDQKVFNLNPDYFSYTISKLALERSVMLQAQALAPKIRVVGIAPGLIYVSGPQDKENFEKARSINLLQSPTRPEDVAKAAVFLAENESITGVTLLVDKGQHLVPLERDVMFVTEQFLGKMP